MALENYIVVLVTAKNKSEARKIAKKLLDSKLIACANILGGVLSLFFWKGKIDEANEVLIIMKTTKKLFKEVERKVKELHSYDTPEIIALPIIDGSADYLKWVSGSTRGRNASLS